MAWVTPGTAGHPDQGGLSRGAEREGTRFNRNNRRHASGDRSERRPLFGDPMRSKKKAPKDKEIDVLEDDATFVEDLDDVSTDADACSRGGCTRGGHDEGGGHCLIHF